MTVLETEDIMTIYETLSIIGQYAGLSLIWYGLYNMSKASDKRNRELDEIIANQAESRRGFEQLIKGMETVIERTAK